MHTAGSLLTRAPHVAALTLLTMILTSTSDPSSIFEHEKLKPGIYKIQNLDSGTYLDIHQYSKEVCCRPAQNLEDGKGLVCPSLPLAVRVSDE